MAAELVLFDDPLNPRGWVMEPTRRRLALAFPELAVRVRPVGMVESWDAYDGPELEGGRAAVPAVCARLSEVYGMPIDEFLWFDDPPESSWPACRAIAAAGLQDGAGPEAAGRLLRACREATFARQTRIDDPGTLDALVESVPGLDADALRAAVDDGRADEGFESARSAAADLDAPGVARAGDRCELPTLLVRTDDGARGVSGIADFEDVAGAVAAVTGREPGAGTAGVEAVLERFSAEGWLARVELARLAGLPPREAAERVAPLVADGTVVESTFAAEPFFRLAEYAPADAEAAVDGGDDARPG